jgi:hypothetical protein
LDKICVTSFFIVPFGDGPLALTSHFHAVLILFQSCIPLPGLANLFLFLANDESSCADDGSNQNGKENSHVDDTPI